jgi:hypothetical protein
MIWSTWIKVYNSNVFYSSDIPVLAAESLNTRTDVVDYLLEAIAVRS